MIDLSGFNYRQILQQMLAQIPASFDKRDTSPIPTALSPAAYALEGFYITLNAVQSSAFIQTAGGQALDYLAVIGNVSRAPASPAVRLGVFNTAVQNAVDPPLNQGLGLGMAPIGAKVTISAATALTVDVAADVTLAAGYSIAQVQPLAEAAIAEYLLEVRRGWGTPINDTTAAYAANVYQSRVLAAILGVTGVVNVTNVTLNGAAADLRLIESGELQQVPIMGTVTLNG